MVRAAVATAFSINNASLNLWSYEVYENRVMLFK